MCRKIEASASAAAMSPARWRSSSGSSRTNRFSNALATSFMWRCSTRVMALACGRRHRQREAPHALRTLRKHQRLIAKVQSFMDEHIVPAVPTYQKQDKEGDRWKVIPVVEELKAKAKAAGLW